jgi:hypothetical protein
MLVRKKKLLDGKSCFIGVLVPAVPVMNHRFPISVTVLLYNLLRLLLLRFPAPKLSVRVDDFGTRINPKFAFSNYRDLTKAQRFAKRGPPTIVSEIDPVREDWAVAAQLRPLFSEDFTESGCDIAPQKEVVSTTRFAP